MKFRCFFDPVSDQCVGAVALENGWIPNTTRQLFYGEVFVMQTPRYEPVNFLSTIPRELELDVYPIGADINNLLFAQERTLSCKLSSESF